MTVSRFLGEVGLKVIELPAFVVVVMAFRGWHLGAWDQLGYL